MRKKLRWDGLFRIVEQTTGARDSTYLVQQRETNVVMGRAVWSWHTVSFHFPYPIQAVRHADVLHARSVISVRPMRDRELDNVVEIDS